MDSHMADELVVPLKFPGDSVHFFSHPVLGCVEELVVAKELWNDHKKLIFFPFPSAETCTNCPLEVDQSEVLVAAHIYHTIKPQADRILEVAPTGSRGGSRYVALCAVMASRGTPEVKETKANILVHEYEMFKMSPVETIIYMFAQFSNITNGLKVFGKNYTDTEIVCKVLRSLPPAWHTKAIVIEDSKNLSTLTVEELIRSLMIYEIKLKREEAKQPIPLKQKDVVLKAKKSKAYISKENSSSEDEEEVANTKARLDEGILFSSRMEDRKKVPLLISRTVEKASTSCVVKTRMLPVGAS
ncbi:hypothetical protein Taro_016635 [Colocasia esculenta]|uniref:UBN2 domain-containing protein n=1 Tax=Colocasia esculenta TaxID=4460 RepID=A0A843UKV6_COLES|nr:hypothetical protein [Colocasia esculenta]